MTSDLNRNKQRESWKGRGVAFFLIGGVILAAAWVVSKILLPSPPHPKSDDPRLTFETRYRNVRPEVGYVGDEVCAGCHPAMAENYRKHPMARSLAPIAQANPLERYDASAHNPFDAMGFRYEIDRPDHSMIHTEKRVNSKGQDVCEMKEHVQYALGSGVRGRSYLIERDGFLFQSPISWYAGTNVWDLAPAYRVNNQHFTRPVPDECVYCHANRAEPVPSSLNHFRTPIFRGYAIGCERCHGPGELHVQLRERDKSFVGEDDTIVVPDRLDPELRESVCQQCHLQAVVRVVKRNRQQEDYRPGLPLNQFLSYFVLPPRQRDSKRAVGQVEQMYASRCFQESGGTGAKLGCLSCHDPHYYPDAHEKAKYYRQRCLTCHADCGIEVTARRAKSPSDNCIECHMPNMASSNIAHTAITDHRIVRRPGIDRPSASAQKAGADKYPIVALDLNGGKLSDPDWQRDLGLALIDFASKQPSPEWGRLAEPLLEQSLERWPEDSAAWEAKGYALMLQGREQDALQAFRAALSRAPNREKSLFGAALMAGQIGQGNDAIEFWTKAIALNPWNWEYHDELAKLQADRQEWKNAAEQCRQALKLNIASWETRKLLIKCLLRLGEKTKARSELEILLGFEPPDPEALRRWFAEEGK